MFTDNYDSSFRFWLLEERLTHENCFLFCKKYGLLNGFIFLTIKKFLLSYFPTFMVSVLGRGGRQDLSISYLKLELFQAWRGLVHTLDQSFQAKTASWFPPPPPPRRVFLLQLLSRVVRSKKLYTNCFTGNEL